MIEENNCCISCGNIIPEGSQHCPSCILPDDNSIEEMHIKNLSEDNVPKR